MRRWLEGSSSFYRLAQRLSPLAGLLRESEEEVLAAERRREVYSAESLVFRPGDPRILRARQEYPRWLDAIAEVAAAHSLPVVPLATPFELQLPLPSADARPQRRLEKYASDRGWVYVDWLDALQRLATDGGNLPRGEIARRLAALPPHELRRVWRRFFLDEDHPSAAGHRFAAKLLLRSLLWEPATRPLLGDAPVQRSPEPDGG